MKQNLHTTAKFKKSTILNKTISDTVKMGTGETNNTKNDIPYFPAYKTHPDFFIRNFRKNDECILILVIYWKKKGLLRTEISNRDIIYSSQKPRKSSSLPLKSSSQLISLDASLIDVRVFVSLEINTYPRRIRRS
jgi:hypothetical protein